MSRKTPVASKNPAAKAVRTPRFKPQVVRDKTKYRRKEKHK